MIHINHNFQEINATISSLIGICLIIIVHKHDYSLINLIFKFFDFFAHYSIKTGLFDY